jgi:HK97 family phage major capsid protein
MDIKLKFLVDADGYKKGTLILCDEITAKTFIDAKSAEVYTEELEKKDAEVIKETIDLEVKQIKKESKMTDEVKSVETKDTSKGAFGEWKSFNEFLKAVKTAEESHTVDPRLITKASAGMGEDVNAEGGFLVQHPLFNQEIFNAYINESVIAPRCRQFVAEPYANGLKFKQINESTRAGGNWFGGVQFYNVDEGVSITDSKPVFSQLDIPIKQCGALYYLTQALVDDCPNLVQYVAGLVGKAYGQVLDREVLYGSLSIMTPIVGHNATVKVTLAGTYPTAAELATMYNSMAVGYLDGAEWYMGHKQFAALMNLTSPAGTAQGSYPIMTRDVSEPTKMLLFGHKINVIEQAQAGNTAGSIIFANFDEYAIVTKGTMTPSVAMSLHVKFDSNQQTYRFISRIGGAPLLKSNILLLDQSNVSSVVTTA